MLMHTLPMRPISRVIWLPSFSQSYSFQRLTDIHNLCNESQGVRRLLLQHYGHASFNLLFRQCPVCPIYFLPHESGTEYATPSVQPTNFFLCCFSQPRFCVAPGFTFAHVLRNFSAAEKHFYIAPFTNFLYVVRNRMNVWHHRYLFTSACPAGFVPR